MNTQNRNFNDKEILSVFKTLMRQKKIILTCIFVFSLLSIIYSISLPNLYTSSTLLAPSHKEESLSSKLNLGSFSSIAGFAGVNLPGEGSSPSKEAIERIKSFEFFSNYFLPHIQLEDLLASKGWSAEYDEILYDSKKFDANSKKWVRKFRFPQKQMPSDQEAYREFSKILQISEDAKTSFVTISISHYSPKIAKDWLDKIILGINKSMSEEDKKNAENSINFLNEIYNTTNFESLKDSINILMESQMQTFMLASSNKNYIYKILDSPIAPEKKSSPNRSIICILGFLLGTILGIALAIISDYVYRNKQKISDTRT